MLTVVVALLSFDQPSRWASRNGRLMPSKERAFSIRDLIIALMRDQNIHSGFWGLTVHFDASGTSIAKPSQPELSFPGLAVGVTGVTLVPASANEPGSLDASIHNPVKSPAARKLSKPRASNDGL